jgi:DNA-binding CsgD family transcriptional regulator
MNPLERLTPRQRQVVALKAEGLSYKMIAYVLGIELGAALGRGRHAIRRLGVANIKEAAALYRLHYADLNEGFSSRKPFSTEHSHVA